MDKRQKRKVWLAAGFVTVCGLASLGSYYVSQQKEQMVLQRKEESLAADGEGVSVSGKGSSGGAELADGSTGGAGGALDAEHTARTETVPEETLCVYVCGAVAAEGVYSLPAGSRLVDAVDAAGGFTAEADRAYHNLAAYLSDGQKVYVPTGAETEELTAAERLDGRTEAEGGDRKEPLPVNINTADKELLMTLPGIGEAKAESILTYRKNAGPFQETGELKKVSGIGEAMFERIKDKIVVK